MSANDSSVNLLLKTVPRSGSGVSWIEANWQIGLGHVFLGLTDGELPEMKDGGGKDGCSASRAYAFHEVIEVSDPA
jgi:hypothetical protein